MSSTPADPTPLAGRRVLVAVTGGIAAYKACELVRLFVRAGAETRVMMTRGAAEFVTPLTFQALSQHPVATSLFDLTQEASISHITLADEAELVVVAPATADVLAKLAHGLADDLPTTVLLATRAPVLVAPAMNVNMWQHAATQANVVTLRARGVHTVGPDAGDLACGWVGQGRMAEAAEIFAAAASLLGGARDFAGERVLITAGPTYEPIDPVRFLGNRSTGKMGFAIAEAAARRGAQVTLVAGPTALPAPYGVERVDVATAVEMQRAVDARAEQQALIVMTAAVADYAVAEIAADKLKKEALGAAPTLQLRPNPDILAELGRRFAGRALGTRPLLVGFAAETRDVERHAADKRRHKGCDLIVANDVSEPGSGFGADTNRVCVVDETHAEWWPQAPKGVVAERLLDKVRSLRATKAP